MSRKFLFLMFLILSTSAFAIGISPYKKTILFKPNYSESITYTVLNENPFAIEARLYVKGDLN